MRKEGKLPVCFPTLGFYPSSPLMNPEIRENRENGGGKGKRRINVLTDRYPGSDLVSEFLKAWHVFTAEWLSSFVCLCVCAEGGGM